MNSNFQQKAQRSIFVCTIFRCMLLDLYTWESRWICCCWCGSPVTIMACHGKIESKCLTLALDMLWFLSVSLRFTAHWPPSVLALCCYVPQPNLYIFYFFMNPLLHISSNHNLPGLLICLSEFIVLHLCCFVPNHNCFAECIYFPRVLL